MIVLILILLPVVVDHSHIDKVDLVKVGEAHIIAS